MGRKHKSKTSPAQRDSGNSILGVGSLGILRSLGILGEQPVMKTTPAQRDSEISILAIRPLCPYCPLVLKTTPAQQGSEISKFRIPIGPIGPIKNNIKATNT